MCAGARYPSRAFGHRGRKAGRAEILDGDHGVSVGEVHARFEQALLEEGIADLHSWSSLRAGLVQLQRRERRPVDAIATCVGADEHQAVAGALGPGMHELIDANEAYTHRVDERVVGVALIEIDLAAHRWDADAVAVPADACDYSLDVTARFRQRPEAQRVQQGDGPGAHRDDVADDAAHAGRGALIR